ncbi:MAG: Mur ligase domain-containing protein [Vicinamibacterales bacterium]
MTLSDAVAIVNPGAGAPPPGMSPDVPVASIAYDSRRVAPGAVFVALRGLKADGAAFASQALSRGAVAIVAETDPPDAVSAPWIRTGDARLALALLADAFYDHPSRRMPVVGVTGRTARPRPPTCWPPSSTRRACRPGSWAPSPTASDARSVRPPAPRPRRPTCSTCWPR